MESADAVIATAIATGALVVVTALLVFVTWRLERVTGRSAEATEKSAAAAAQAAVAMQKQAELSRQAIEAETTPVLVPAALDKDWNSRILHDTGRPRAWPVVYYGDPDTPIAEMRLRNDGVGSAILRRAQLHGIAASWDGEADVRVIPPGGYIHLRFSLAHPDPSNEREVMHRDRIAAGELTISAEYADVLGIRTFESRVVTKVPQESGPMIVQQGFQVREGERFIIPLESTDASLQDNPEAREGLA